MGKDDYTVNIQNTVIDRGRFKYGKLLAYDFQIYL